MARSAPRGAAGGVIGGHPSRTAQVGSAMALASCSGGPSARAANPADLPARTVPRRTLTESAGSGKGVTDGHRAGLGLN